MSITSCLSCVATILKVNANCAGCVASEGFLPPIGDPLICGECLLELASAVLSCTECAEFTYQEVKQFIEEEIEEMACTTYHTTKTQGAGLCCQAVQSGALTPPPIGTILPAYTPGSAATLPVGRIVQVTDAGGHCASCMIVGSKSTKHPGRPVLKYIRGGPTCPTATQGCCTLAGTGLVQSL